jgi:hypothetical protein
VADDFHAGDVKPQWFGWHHRRQTGCASRVLTSKDEKASGVTAPQDAAAQSWQPIRASLDWHKAHPSICPRLLFIGAPVARRHQSLNDTKPVVDVLVFGTVLKGSDRNSSFIH